MPGDLTIVEAACALRRSLWYGYAAAFGIYLLATGSAYLVEPGGREAMFITYLPAIVFATLLGGGHAGLLVAIAGGLTVWLWLTPPDQAEVALTLALYVNAAAFLLLAMDALNRAIDALQRERDRSALMFRELQHRTANNLTFISGFLRMQRKDIRDNPERAMPAIEQAMHRLDAFARIHRHLTEPVQGERSVELLFRQLCENLIAGAGRPGVAVSVDIEPVELPFDQVLVLSLLLAETVTNAVKHAFGEERDGTIAVVLATRGAEHVFEVRDNGRGVNEAAFNVRGQGLGHTIMVMLAAQLGGTLSWTMEDGLCTRVVFPRLADGNSRKRRRRGALPPEGASTPAWDWRRMPWLNAARQRHDQQHDQHQTEHAGGAVSPVAAMRPARHGADQQHQEDDKQQR